MITQLDVIHAKIVTYECTYYFDNVNVRIEINLDHDSSCETEQ